MTDNINFKRIENDIQTDQVVLYMNGTPMFPRCCTSAMVVQFLDSYKIDYKSYNLMEEISLLDCLKEYTGRAVIPQLFIVGRLIGMGEDLREMFVNGEILKILAANNITKVS